MLVIRDLSPFTSDSLTFVTNWQH